MLNPCRSIDPVAMMSGFQGRAGTIARLVLARRSLAPGSPKYHACSAAYFALCYGGSAATARKLYLDVLAQ